MADGLGSEALISVGQGSQKAAALKAVRLSRLHENRLAFTSCNRVGVSAILLAVVGLLFPDLRDADDHNH